MSKVSFNQDPNDSDIYYFNGIQYNSSDISSVPAEIDVNLQAPLIQNSNEYEVSVMRLLVSGNALPLFIVEPTTSTAPYGTKYEVEMEYNGGFIAVDVTYTPQNDINIKQFQGDKIFYIYNYQDWLDNINDAYKRCYDILVSQITGIELVASSPPIFIYDSTTNLISIYAESSYNSNLVNGIKIRMNKLLFDFFPSFDAFIKSDPYEKVASYSKVRLLITPTNSFLLSSVGNIPPAVGSIVPINPYTVWKVQQEYETVSTWNSIRSLLLTSNIGTISESIPNVGGGLNQDISRSSLQILTDFDLDFSSSNRSGGRGIIQYLPTAEYRWTSILSGGPLNRINVKVQFLTFRNEVINLYLNPNFTFTIKLLFKKKVQTIKL
jgi:hypothetical protein